MSRKDTYPQRQIAYYIDMMDSKADWKLRNQPIVYNAHPFEDSRMEVDVYLPFSRVGVEYDGKRFHGGDPESELRKYESCKAQGITLYRVTDMVSGDGDPYEGTADHIIRVEDPSDITHDIEPILSDIAETIGLKRYQGWSKTHQELDRDYFADDPHEWRVSDFGTLSDSWDSDRNRYLYDKGAEDVCIDDPSVFAWSCPDCFEQYEATIYDRMNGKTCSVSESGGRHKRKRMVAEEPRSILQSIGMRFRGGSR